MKYTDQYKQAVICIHPNTGKKWIVPETIAFGSSLALTKLKLITKSSQQTQSKRFNDETYLLLAIDDYRNLPNE